MGAGLSGVSAVRAANENSNSPRGLSDCLTSGGFDSGRVLGWGASAVCMLTHYTQGWARF